VCKYKLVPQFEVKRKAGKILPFFLKNK